MSAIHPPGLMNMYLIFIRCMQTCMIRSIRKGSKTQSEHQPSMMQCATPTRSCSHMYSCMWHPTFSLHL